MSAHDPHPDPPTVEYPPTAVADDTRASQATSGSAGITNQDNALPAKIGKYRVVECLGAGGQGEVFRAVHPTLGRDVVIKWGGRDLPASIQERLIDEGRALARLDDPGVVRVYDVDLHEGRPYLVFEYVQGQSLASRIKRRRPTLREAVGLVVQIAAIVDRVHQHGILHRDLKPGNILIDEDNRPRLLDFGLASLTQPWDDDRQPREGVVGTLAYMAPEQTKGESQFLGPETDVFGLGALLYELLTGRPPYRGKNRAAVWEQVCQGRIVPPRSLNPRIPRRLETICLKALAFEPESRYASAADLRQALRRFLQRRWLIAIATIHVLLFLIALSVATFRPFDRTDSPAPPDRPPPRRLEPLKPPDGWKVYRPGPGRFSVWLPGVPKESVSEVGQRQMHEGTLNDTRAGLFYRTVYADFEGIRFGQIQERLDSARDGALRNVGGDLLKEKNITYDKHPGREILMEVPKVKGARFRIRMYLVDQRLYQLLVGGKGENVNSKEADQFFNSFQLVGDKP